MKRYISLGSMCYGTTIMPYWQESLPFDSVNNSDNIESVYSVLQRLMDGSFDVKDFVDELNEKHINKEGFNFVHFDPPKDPKYTREEIFVRRFSRLTEVLSDDSEKTFLYYNRAPIVNEKELEIVEKIHNLFPTIKFVYFDRWCSFPLVQSDWLKSYHINTDPNLRPVIHERIPLLKTALKTDVYSEEEKEKLQIKLDKILLELAN